MLKISQTHTLNKSNSELGKGNLQTHNTNSCLKWNYNTNLQCMRDEP